VADDEGRQQTTGDRLPEAGPGGPPPPLDSPGGSATGPGIRLGRPFGVPLYVSPSWFLIAGFITYYFAPDNSTDLGPALGNWRYALSFTYAVFLYASVVVHELAHAVIAKRFGLPVRRIVVHFLGGVSEIEREAETPGREFWIAFVGPLTSAVLAALGFGVYLLIPHGDGLTTGGKVVATLVFGFWASNLLVALFNMLPGLPLDGGRVLRAIVWASTGNSYSGTVAAAWTGRALAVVVFFGTSYLYSGGGTPDLLGITLAAFMAMFIWFGASQALIVGRLRQRIPGLSARELTRRAISVEARVPLGEALRRAHEAGARGVIVVDGIGRPVGLVNEAQVIATPEQRRPWIDVGTVSRTMEDGLIIPATLTGETLLEALRAYPAPEYLVVEPSGEIFGVLASTDVQAAFLGKPVGQPSG
jgi:Zn-dependent protease/CBS domain-containing protein